MSIRISRNSSRSSRSSHVAAAAMVLALSLVPHRAAAQSDEERSGARAAATAGMDALREHRWSDAVDLFTRAERVIHAPTHLLYLSQAQAQLGVLVKAHENLERAAREPLAPNAPAAFREAQQEAQKELEKLEERLPYVTVNVEGGESAQVAVTEDGHRISDALIGVPRPVDPGSHTFVATAAGLQGSATIDVKERSRETVILKLVPLGSAPTPTSVAPTPTPQPQPASAAPTATPSAPAPSTLPSTPDTTASEGGGSNGMRIGSYVAFGVGAVGLGLGTVFLLSGSSKSSQANDAFNQDNCAAGCSADDQAHIKSLDNSASSAKAIGVAGLVVGGAAVATGVVLFVMSGKKSSTPAAGLMVHPWVGVGSAGFDGTF